MTPPQLPYPLDLGDGLEPIMCRDAHQAALLRSLWIAYIRCTSREQATANVDERFT